MIGNIKAFCSKHRYPLLLVLIALLSHAQWFNPLSILQSGDWQFRFNEHVRQLLDSWSSWIGFTDFGSPNIQLFAYPLRGITWGILATVGFSYDIITKLTLFIPIALGSFLIPYFVGRRLVTRPLIAFVGAMFYATTTYILIMETRHLLIGMVYVLAPLLFYCAHLLRTRNRGIDWAVAGLAFTGAIVYELRIMYIIFAILALYFIYEWIFGDIRSLKIYLKPFLAWCGFMLLLNAYWILPTLLGAGSTISATADRGLFGDNLFTLPQSFTIFRWSWTGGYEDRSFIVQPIQWYLWLVPIVAFSMLAIRKRFRKELLFFGIVAMIGILLTKQSAPPIEGLYLWLYNHVPGFDLFREASKFYVITAFAYWGLIIYGLRALSKSSVRIHNLAYIAASVALIIVATINLKPLVTRDIGAVFVNSQVPSDYVVLKDFLTKQSSYSRTLWAPLPSAWGYYDNHHPKMGVLTYAGKDWRALDLQEKPLPSTEQLPLGSLQNSLSASLLNSASVQYVIVPNRNFFNYDDQFIAYGGRDNADIRDTYIKQLDQLPYLQRKNIGTKELVVYENKTYAPYINTPTNLFKLTSLDGLAKTYSSLDQVLNKDFHFASSVPSNLPGQTITNIFTHQQSPASAKQTLAKTFTVSQPSSLVATEDAQELSYSVANDTFTLKRSKPYVVEPNDASRTISITKTNEKEVIGNATLASAAAYYLAVDKTLTPLDASPGDHRTTPAKQNVSLLHQISKNLLPNATFQEKPWASEDCNRQDPDAFTPPSLASNPKNPAQKYMVVTASKHVGCAVQKGIPVIGGTSYHFSLDYWVQHGNYAGYAFTFNTKEGTITQNYLPAVEGADWQHIDTLIKVPATATSASLTLYSYSPIKLLDYTSVAYDNATFTSLEQIMNLPISRSAPLTVPLKSTGTYTARYNDAALDTSNHIANPSFEDGLWKSKVSDCNNSAGGQADIRMRTVSQASDKQKALELQARRHIACTATRTTVEQNRIYTLAFDYRNVSGDAAGYHIAFDDPAKTILQGRVSGGAANHWHTFSKDIQIPTGTHTMTITLYSYGNANRRDYAINQYDNFSLTTAPDILDDYYVISSAASITTPKSIRFTVDGATTKKATITGITGPFYLKMNESYHPKWVLNIAGIGTHYTVNNANHFKIDNVFNAWYIDTAKLCSQGMLCGKNADGSYNIEVTITYTPQTWFHLGLAASGITFIGGLWFVTYYAYKRRKAAASS